jgi:Ca2+-binding EF-hand superfamily protein
MAEYDRNKDGSVSYDEFYKVQVSKGGLKKRFDAADTNRDGFVTLKEADARVQFLQAQAAGTL